MSHMRLFGRNHLTAGYSQADLGNVPEEDDKWPECPCCGHWLDAVPGGFRCYECMIDFATRAEIATVARDLAAAYGHEEG